MDARGLLEEVDGEWQGMPEDTLMGHIHLHVSDIETTEKYYVDGLGFDIVTRFPGALFASTNGYHHHIGLNVWNGVGAPKPVENSVGLNWFSLIFGDENSRNSAVERLQAQGGKVKKDKDDYVAEDPSGNVIRLRVE